MRKRRARGLLIALAASTVAAACGGKSGGGTPTASPTPFTPTNCQLVWLTSSSANNATYNSYVVDMPLAQWTTGAKTFSAVAGGNEGTFYYQLDLQQATSAAVGLATNGTFNVTATGTTKALPVMFADSDPQSYFDAANVIVGAQIATNGVGTFDGEWSDPDPAANYTFGSGTVAVLFQGSNLSLGADGAFGFCYDQNAFAPQTPAQRGLRFLSRASF